MTLDEEYPVQPIIDRKKKRDEYNAKLKAELKKCEKHFAESKTATVQIRLMPTEKAVLEQKAKAYGMTVSEYIRYMLIYK